MKKPKMIYYTCPLCELIEKISELVPFPIHQHRYEGGYIWDTLNGKRDAVTIQSNSLQGFPTLKEARANIWSRHG